MAVPPEGTYRLNLVVQSVQQMLDGGRNVVAEIITLGVDPADPDGYNAGWFGAGLSPTFQITITNADMFGKFNAGAAVPFDATPAAGLTVTEVAPDVGPHSGGTEITLTGTGFRDGMYVSVGGRLATEVNVTSDTTGTAIVPASGLDPEADAVVDVKVSAYADFSAAAMLAGGFTYKALTITGVDPAVSGESTHVTITGTGFYPGLMVWFGGTLATELDFVSDTELTCIPPDMAPGVVDVVLSYSVDQSNPATLAGGFTYA
jgi:IPT/TIG domain